MTTLTARQIQATAAGARDNQLHLPADADEALCYMAGWLEHQTVTLDCSDRQHAQNVTWLRGHVGILGSAA